MSKYEPLARFLAGQQGERVPVTFGDIERLIGSALPQSKRYPAWWSNNPSNNPMTKVWLNAGFVTEQVDTAGERLTFRRADRKLRRPPASGGIQPGAMRGTVQIAPGVDLTTPADPSWGAVYK